MSMLPARLPEGRLQAFERLSLTEAEFTAIANSITLWMRDLTVGR